MWQDLYEINLLHVFRVTHAFLPSMLEQQRGAIVNVSSVEGARGYPPDPVYGAFKAAVIHFTKCLAVDVAGRGVRVNGIGPDLTQSQQVDYEHARHRGQEPLADLGARRATGRTRGPGAGDPLPRQRPVGVHRGPDAVDRRRERRGRRLVPHRASRGPALDEPPDRSLMTCIAPWLAVDNAAEALRVCVAACAAAVLERLDDVGRVTVAQLSVDDAASGSRTTPTRGRRRTEGRCA